MLEAQWHLNPLWWASETATGASATRTDSYDDKEAAQRVSVAIAMQMGELPTRVIYRSGIERKK
jgi:hypothetical protein